jgi:hypothetical protein
MGVAPEAIAEFFGYRLKKIDMPVPYISSCDIFRHDSPFQSFFPSFLVRQAPESKTRYTVLLDRYFLIPLFFVYIFFLDTLILLYHLYLKNLKAQKYILGLVSPEAH